LKGKRNFWYFY